MKNSTSKENTRFKNFIKKFYDKYSIEDYLLIEDIKSWSNKKVYVNCKEHGIVRSLANSSLFKSTTKTPCPSCNLAIRGSLRSYSTETFISKAESIHKDLYEYEDTVYKGVKEKVNIFCKKCEKPFSIVADYLLSGCGCQTCAQNSRDRKTSERKGTKRKKRTLTIEEVHAYQYPDAMLTDFQSSNIGKIENGRKVLAFGNTGVKEGYFVKCLCGKNNFIVDEFNRVKSYSCGCIKADKLSLIAFENLTNYLKKERIPVGAFTFEDYKEGKFEYNCPKHGCQILPAKIDRIKRLKNLCPQCSVEDVADSSRLSLEDVEVALTNFTSSKYTEMVDISDYKTVSTRNLKFKCNKTGNIFLNSVNGMRASSGCPCCCNNGFKRELSGVIYINIFLNESEIFIKVGITNISSKVRLGQQTSSYYEGFTAFELESDGNTLAEVELAVSKNFDKIYVDRERFPDGFSECYHIKDYHNIKEFIKERIKQC